MTRFISFFARKTSKKLSVLLLVFGTSFFYSPTANAANTGQITVTCANADGVEKTFNVGWSNTEPFFNGKGDIAMLFCDIATGNQYKTFVSTTVSDMSLRFYAGLIPATQTSTAVIQEPVPATSPSPVETPTVQASPQPTVSETPTSTPSPEPSPSETTTVQSPESNTVTITPSPVASETATQTTDTVTVLNQETATSTSPPQETPLPEPTPVVPQTPPAVQPEPTPQPEPAPAPEPAPQPAPEPAPEVAPEPPAPAPKPEVAPEPQPDPEPAPAPEPEPEPSPEPAPEPELVPEPAPEPPIIKVIEQVTPEPQVPQVLPEPTVTLDNGVVLTKEVAVALELLNNPAQLIAELFTDPGQVLTAISNIGADMSPEVRKQSEKVVLSAIIAGNIATQAAATAAGLAAYRRKP